MIVLPLSSNHLGLLQLSNDMPHNSEKVLQLSDDTPQNHWEMLQLCHNTPQNPENVLQLSDGMTEHTTKKCCEATVSTLQALLYLCACMPTFEVGSVV